MHILSKSTYIKGMQCPKALYMQKKHPYLRDRLSIEQRAIFRRGTDVGILAHDCYPGGLDMSPASASQFPKKAAETMENMNNPSVNVMYEAVFQYNDTLIMLDMLVRDGDRWTAIEVKSSMALSETYYNDAALQYYVLHGCRVPLSDFKLMYLNGDYCKNGPIDVDKLFRSESVLEYVKLREPFVESNVERLKGVVALPHAPAIPIGTQCHNPYTCDFIGHCWKKVPQNSFLHMTALNDKVLFEQYHNGIDTNAKMLERVPDNSVETYQIEALESNTYYIDYKIFFNVLPKIKLESSAFLNLLLYRPAIPETDGMKPYQEMILAFALKGAHEAEGQSVWHCFDDHGKWKEAIPLLIEKIAKYEKIVCFTPQNTTSTLLRHEIIHNQSVADKVFNLFEALEAAHFYHARIKNGFTLQHVTQAVFPEMELFEHSRILMNALGGDFPDTELAIHDLCTENETVERIFRHFCK